MQTNQYQNWLRHKSNDAKRHLIRLGPVYSEPRNIVSGTDETLMNNVPTRYRTLSNVMLGNPNWPEGYRFHFWGPAHGSHVGDIDYNIEDTERNLPHLYHPSIMGSRTIEPLPVIHIRHPYVSNHDAPSFIDNLSSMMLNHVHANPWFGSNVLPHIVGRHLSSIYPWASIARDYYMDNHERTREDQLPEIEGKTLS